MITELDTRPPDIWLWELRGKGAAQLAINRLDREIGYPALTAIHRPLLDFADEVRRKVIAERKTINRDEQVGKIADFFGLEGPVIPVSAPGHALVSAIEALTSPTEEILIPEPAYPFEKFVNCLPHSKRVAHRINTSGLREVINQARDKSNNQSAIIETPCDPALFRHPDKEYEMLAQPNGLNIVIYDRVNDIYSENTSVQKAVGGNRLHRPSFPISDRAVIVEGTSKLFPEEFPNLAIVKLSDSVHAQMGKEYEEFIHRMNFRTPSNINLYVMAEILHSEFFPQFLADIIRLTYENFKFLEESLKGVNVKYDGNYAWVEPSAIGPGINALNSYQHCTLKGGQGVPFYIRLPIVVDREELEQTFINRRVRTVVFW